MPDPLAHAPDAVACPHLPPVGEPLRAAAMKALGRERGPAFYLRALECAQSLWLQGLPAQSILLMNRAFSADLSGEEEVLREWPLPYRAMKWVMVHRREDQFIGNPRRHFQHLATRMVEPRRELRTWRAWGCWWYARLAFPDEAADEVQMEREAIREPGPDEIHERLDRLGLPGEAALWREGADG